jgi:hypothetical protein
MARKGAVISLSSLKQEAMEDRYKEKGKKER